MDLFLEETGKQNQETIVFLHGGTLSGGMWEKQLEAFSDYHCLIPDLPEHGKSHNIGPFTIEDAADRVLDIIKKRAHNGKAHVVGISLGAQIIVQMLSKSPELIDHAVISGTLVRQIPQSELILKLLEYTIKAYMPIKDSDFLIKANIRSYGIPKDNFMYLKEATKEITADSLNRILHENMFFKIPDGLEKAENPVLIISGRKEYGIIKESARDLREVLPHSHGCIAKDMVHVWNMVNPDFFNEVVRAWITDNPLPVGMLPLE